VMMGQGTLALELLEEVPDLDCIIAPISGGGMLSGICVAAKGVNPNIRIFAAEPKGADDAYQSLVSGVLTGHKVTPVTICDGLKTGEVGVLPWPIIKENCERVFTCYDEKTREAMFLLWERMKLIVEPSGAIGLAAVLSNEFKSLQNIKKVGVVISGGNLDIKSWDWNAPLPDQHLQQM